MDRREFLKLEAAAMAAAAGGLPMPAGAQNLVTDRSVTELKWDKAPCRFCGTGCGVMVATKDGRVVATHGDIKAEVNRGLNCVKGYFLSKVMYGHDRLTRPLLRKRNGKYDKNGEFTEVSWDEAFDVMAEKFKEALARRGPSGVGMFGSGQWTIWEGYAANKLFKAGFRSNNLDPNARHCMASAAMAFMRTFGIDEPMGCYDDFEAADAFVLWGSNMAEMHPILWSRVTDRRLSAPHVQVAVLSTFRASLVRARRPGDRLQAAERSGDPQCRRQSHHHDEAREQGLHRQAYHLQTRSDRHRLRAAAGSSAGAEGIGTLEGG